MRAGKCWRLYPEAFHQNYMPPYTLAEMLRTPLEELVLQVKQRRCMAESEGAGAGMTAAAAAGGGVIVCA